MKQLKGAANVFKGHTVIVSHCRNLCQIRTTGHSGDFYNYPVVSKSMINNNNNFYCLENLMVF